MTIKEAREKAKLTQAEVARIFKVSKRAVEEWEYGKRNPRDKQMAEKIEAYGMLTGEGRESLLAGEITWEYVLSIYKYEQTKRLSKWGRYGDTFSACWDRIPDSVAEIATPEMLAELIDNLKDAYNDGVYYGRHHVEE